MQKPKVRIAPDHNFYVERLFRTLAIHIDNGMKEIP